MLLNLANNPRYDSLALDTSDQRFAAVTAHPAWGRNLGRAGAITELGSCDVVFTMLPDSTATNRVIAGGDGYPGLKDVLTAGSRIVDLGSSNPLDTMALAPDLATRGIVLTDAPVSGAVAKAVSRELTFMVGGDEGTLEVLRPPLSTMGKVFVVTGPVGSAHAMKALNNYVYAAGLLATSEAVAIASRMGLDLERFADILNASSGRNVATETKLRKFILSEQFSGGFSLRLQAKDLATAAGIMARTGASAPQLALCNALWAAAAATLEADADNTKIFSFISDGGFQNRGRAGDGEPGAGADSGAGEFGAAAANR